MIAPFSARRIAVIAQKELRHIRRDRLSLTVTLLVPVLMVFFFGFAIDFDVRDVDILVSDSDNTRLSRQLVEMLEKSGYFRVRRDSSVVDAAAALGADKAKVVLIIPPRFSHNIATGRPVSVQALLDGADDQTAAIVTSYLSSIQAAERARLGAPPPSAELRTRFVFNQELDTHWFIISGLFATILAVFSTLLPALSVAREWENGSMERLLTTPVKPLDIILGKLAPYFLIAASNAVLIYGLARWLFRVPFRGSHVALVLATILFLLASISQGLLISVTMRAQRLAYQMSLHTGTWPAQLLSGFIFPIANMPVFFQWLVTILPARWYMTILRSTFLRAATLETIVVPLLALSALATAFIAAAALMFKTDLEP